MNGQGSAGNVIAALCSFCIPGLGQLLQARVGRALFHFCASALLWFIFLGWLGHIWSAYDAARFEPRGF